MDLGHQPRSLGELRSACRSGSAAHDDLEGQQGRRVPAVGQHHLRYRLIRVSPILATLFILALHATPAAWSAVARPPLFPLQQLAPGVYAVLGDTGRGSEGRANA